MFSYFIVKTLILFNIRYILKNYEKITHDNFKDFIIGIISIKFIETLQSFMSLIKKHNKNSEIYNSLTMVYLNEV